MKILSDLIKIPSISGNETELAKFLFNYFLNIGLAPIMQDGNVILHFSGKDKQSALILNAHMDTVSAGDISLWTYPPFGENAGVIKAGKMYGLGTSDVKGSVALLCILSQKLKTKKPATDVWITFVVGEEIDGSGTKSFLKYFSKYKKSYKHISAIVSEPTGGNSLEIGNRGESKVKITTTGDSGHGSRPHEVKTHAIEEMFKVIDTMKKIEEYSEKEFTDNRLGIPSFALTGIFSNENSLNKIPTSCWTFWDIRTTPKMHAKLLQILEKKLGENISVEVIEGLNHTPVLIGTNEKIIKMFQAVLPDIQIKTSPGANDVTFFVDANIPAVTFGPGLKKVIHKENEYIEIEKVNKALEIYKILLLVDK